MSTMRRETLDPKSYLYYAPRRVRESVGANETEVEPEPNETPERLPVEQLPRHISPPLDDRHLNGVPHLPELQANFESVADVRRVARRSLIFAIAACAVSAAGVVAVLLAIQPIRSLDRGQSKLAAVGGNLSISALLDTTGVGQTEPPPQEAAAPLPVKDTDAAANRLPTADTTANIKPVAAEGSAADVPKAKAAPAADLPRAKGVPAADAMKNKAAPAADAMKFKVAPAAELPRAKGVPAADAPKAKAAPAADAMKFKAAPAADAMKVKVAPAADATNVKVAPAADAPKVDVASVPAVRAVDPDRTAALMKRADALIASGDLPSARLILQWLAETHNAQAAYQLGMTYDPAFIQRLGAVSIVPDPTRSRTWYERARDWGSSKASQRLRALAAKDTSAALGN